MQTIIINDCRDANAAGRQVARAGALIGGAVSIVGVGSDLEAAGNLIDILDAFEENPGVILVNVVPRHGSAKRWKNGTPFGYFRYRGVLVAASVDGLTLSLVKKLQLVKSVCVLPVPETVERLISAGALPEELRDAIRDTQFRSYDYLPRIAAFLSQGGTLQGEELSLDDIADAPPAVWWIDNFGNCKTTLFEEEKGAVRIRQPYAMRTASEALPYYARLKDVPDHAAALITGSSGLPGQRFLEIVVQGGSAERELGLSVGAMVVA